MACQLYFNRDIKCESRKTVQQKRMIRATKINKIRNKQGLSIQNSISLVKFDNETLK
jgi:hypothetical protein